MAVPKIEQLDTLIKQYIGKNKTIVDTKIFRLTAPGENYGSEILKVDLVLKSCDTGNTEDLNVVAKLIPESEFFKIIFNVQITFKNEKGFYDTIVPTLYEFQKKQGIENVVDLFPKFFGARNNLKHDENALIDSDAVLILENLKIKGYVNVDRYVGFDLPTTELILKHLAQFHAVAIALKQKDTKTFETKVKPFLACFNPAGNKPPMDEPVVIVLELLEGSEKCRHLAPQVKKSFKRSITIRDTFREPFATIVHRDLWVNNMMIKFSEGTPTDCKFVDFQMYSYDSPAADLLFFLFTSVETKVLQNDLDHLLQIYHQNFINALKSLNCDLNLTYEGLLDEICDCAEWELAHIIFMTLFIIMAKKGEHITPDKNMDGPPVLTKNAFQESSIQRILWMLEEWDKREWLKF